MGSSVRRVLGPDRERDAKTTCRSRIHGGKGEIIFQEYNLRAWKKSGIRLLDGVAVFTEADFAPSKNTSNRAQVPDSFPCDELPSDFDPLPMYQPEVEPEAHPDTPDDTGCEEGLSYAQFSRDWDAEREGDSGDDDSDEDCGGSNDGNQMEEEEDGQSDAGEEEEGMVGNSGARQMVVDQTPDRTIGELTIAA